MATTAGPTTAELRTWARRQGMDVGDRGRLSPEVLDAWKAAHDDKASAAVPAQKAPAQKAPAPKASKAAAPRPASKKAAAKKAAPASGEPSEQAPEEAATSPLAKRVAAKRPVVRKSAARTSAPVAQPATPEDAAVVEPAGARDVAPSDLEKRLAELTTRVEVLERRFVEANAATTAAKKRRFGRQ